MSPSRLLLTSLLLVPALAAAAPVGDEHAGEDADLALFFTEPEIQTASLNPRPAPRAPGNVSVISRREIVDAGYRSLAELLRRQPGFSIIDDGTRPDAGIRGVHAGAGAPARTLKIMIDGQPISDRSSDASFLGPDLLPMDAVERVEIVRGPMSALYGANAFLGVVNVVTRRAERLEGGHARLAAWRGDRGSEGAGISAWAGFREGPAELLLAFANGGENRNGRRLPRSSPAYTALAARGVLESRDDSRSWLTLFSRARLDGGPKGSLSLQGSFRSASMADPFEARFPMPASGTSRISEMHGEARLVASRALTETLHGSLHLGYAGGRPQQDDRLEVANPSFYLQRRSGHDTLLGGLSLRHRVQSLPLLGQLETSVGADMAHDQLRIETYRSVSRSGTGSVRAGDARRLHADRDAELLNLGAFFEAITTPTQSLELTLGGRLDHHSSYGQQPAARLALVYEAAPGLALKALLGSSFMAPSPDLLLRESSGPGDVVGNPNLRPQQAKSAEGLVSWRPTTGIDLSLAGYVTRVDDLVVLRRQGLSLVATNSAGLDVYGAELSIRGERGPLSFRLGGAWTHATREGDPALGEPLFAADGPAPLFPLWSTNFGATLRLHPVPMQLSVDGHALAERPASDSNALIREQPYALAGQLVIDVALSTTELRPFGGRELRICLRILDLLDEAPSDPGYGGVDLPGRGRQLRLTVEQRF